MIVHVLCFYQYAVIFCHSEIPYAVTCINNVMTLCINRCHVRDRAHSVGSQWRHLSSRKRTRFVFFWVVTSQALKTWFVHLGQLRWTAETFDGFGFAVCVFMQFGLCLFVGFLSDCKYVHLLLCGLKYVDGCACLFWGRSSIFQCLSNMRNVITCYMCSTMGFQIRNVSGHGCQIRLSFLFATAF